MELKKEEKNIITKKDVPRDVLLSPVRVLHAFACAVH
jgi:hypothetical protein